MLLSQHVFKRVGKKETDQDDFTCVLRQGHSEWLGKVWSLRCLSRHVCVVIHTHTFDAKFTFVAIRVCLGGKTKCLKSVTLTNTVILNRFLIFIGTFHFCLNKSGSHF